MDQRYYKDITTTRGFKYHYFSVPAAQNGKPTLLLLHGFPSTSYDWHYQVEFFAASCFGIIVPDLLGYGGTDKPTTADSYKLSLMSKDVVDILDAENLQKVIVVGHDWGSAFASRFVYYHPDRVIAVAFLAIGHQPPQAHFNIDVVNARSEKLLGYTVLGYWLFLAEEGADKLLEEHIDSFLSALFTSDTDLALTDFCPVGALKAWLLSDRDAPRAEYMSEEELRKHKSNLLAGGFGGPLCWYKAMVHGYTPAEEADIPADAGRIEQPVFFGAALQDFVAVPALMKAAITKTCPNATIVDFDTGHWVQLAQPNEVNAALSKWIDGLTLGGEGERHAAGRL